MRKSVLCALVALFVSVVAVAGELPPPITPEDFIQGVQKAAWYWEWLAWLASAGVFTWIARVAVAAVIRCMQWREDSAQVKALQIIEMAVDRTTREFARGAKINGGGKLTQVQADKALDLAIAEAICIAKDEGVNLLKILGKGMLPVWIERVLTAQKGGTVIPPPLPDLRHSAPSV